MSILRHAKDGWKRILALPSFLWYAALFGTLLAAPSLFTGFALDDYLFAIVIRRLPMTVPQTGPFDLFRFADGDPNTARELMEIGEVTWTSDPHTRGAFLRPISALTHIADFSLWPFSSSAMHLHSLLWFFACVAASTLCYRRIIRIQWVAGLSSLLYAVDDVHAQVVSWIANRNALVAYTFGLLSLVLHVQHRQDKNRAAKWWSAAIFGATLLSGEAGIGIIAYFVAYTIHIERGSWRNRAASLAPHGVVLALWRGFYVHFGFGVSGSSIYIDPGNDPRTFLITLPRRLVFLLLGQFAFPRADLAEFYEYISPHAAAWAITFGVAVLALLTLGIVRLWRNDPTARFFLTGAVLSCVPVCGTAPGERLLLFVSFGASGAIALLVEFAESRYERTIATSMMFLHLVVAAPLLALKSSSVAFGEPNRIIDRAIPTAPDIASKTVLLVNPPADSLGMVLIASRVARGMAHPAHLYSLAAVTTDIFVRREDERTIDIRPDRGFIEHSLERSWRSANNPLLAGSVVELARMTVLVPESTPDLRPADARFQFDAPLEDPSFLWLRWDHDHFIPWTPPPIGETVHLPPYGFHEFLHDLAAKLSHR